MILSKRTLKDKIMLTNQSIPALLLSVVSGAINPSASDVRTGDCYTERSVDGKFFMHLVTAILYTTRDGNGAVLDRMVMVDVYDEFCQIIDEEIETWISAGGMIPC